MVTMTDRFRPVSGPNQPARIFPTVISLLVLGCLLGAVGTDAVAASASSDTLVLVNEYPITASDLDGLIMEAHRSMNMAEESSGVVDRLLNKRINDILIVQDAYAAGIDEERELVKLLDDRRQSYAIRAYVSDNLNLPSSPSEESLHAFYDKYYWQVQVRRISVRTFQEASDLKMSIMGGAEMDTLARELSLDTKKLNGGLYNLLYWADLENRIRDRVIGLKVGEISEIFPYNDAFTFCRVEQIIPVNQDDFGKFKGAITPEVLQITNQKMWDQFVDDHIANTDIEESMAGIAGIIADSSMVLKGDFLKQDPSPIIQIPGGGAVTGTEFRKAVSHEVMQNATAPFGENLVKARRKETSELVLAHAAKANGYYEGPEVEAKVAKDMEQGLIETYLADTVASRIKFNRAELDEFYEENKEKFRGPEEVQIDILILETETDARDAAKRLSEGADFGFIFAEYNPGQEATLGKSRHIKRDQLSKPFRDQLVNMKVGESSQAVQMTMGWMVFKLVDVKPGPLLRWSPSRWRSARSFTSGNSTSTSMNT
jgi:parvulin-like peptidyl-prolyl isomerase